MRVRVCVCVCVVSEESTVHYCSLLPTRLANKHTIHISRKLCVCELRNDRLCKHIMSQTVVSSSGNGWCQGKAQCPCSLPTGGVRGKGQCWHSLGIKQQPTQYLMVITTTQLSGLVVTETLPKISQHVAELSLPQVQGLLGNSHPRQECLPCCYCAPQLPSVWYN